MLSEYAFKAGVTDAIETSIYGSQGELVSILICIKQSQSDIFLSRKALGVRSCSNYHVCIKRWSPRALLWFLVLVDSRLFFEKSLEFIPFRPDLFQTFRYIPRALLDQHFIIIMASYDFIVKSSGFMFKTCQADIEKGMIHALVLIV